MTASYVDVEVEHRDWWRRKHVNLVVWPDRDGIFVTRKELAVLATWRWEDALRQGAKLASLLGRDDLWVGTQTTGYSLVDVKLTLRRLDREVRGWRSLWGSRLWL